MSMRQHSPISTEPWLFCSSPHSSSFLSLIKWVGTIFGSASSFAGAGTFPASKIRRISLLRLGLGSETGSSSRSHCKVVRDYSWAMALKGAGFGLERNLQIENEEHLETGTEADGLNEDDFY